MSAELYQTIKNAVGNGYQAIKNTIEHKLVLIGTSVAVGLGALLYSPPVAADSLPHPRYVQENVEYKEIGGKVFLIPVVVDEYQEKLERKIDSLERLIGNRGTCSTGNSSELSVDGERISCTVRYEVCMEKKKVKDCGPGYKKDICIGTTEECDKWKSDSKTEFSIPYTEMSEIRQCGGWGLDNDNVCIEHADGHKHDFDVQDDEAAEEAVSLLEDIRELAIAIRDYRGPDQLLQEARRVRKEYEQAQKSTIKERE